MKNVNVTLAKNILKYRKQRGISQRGLAKKLGVTYQAVSKWETAKCAPDISVLPVLADTFGCNIDELFSRDTKGEMPYEFKSDEIEG